MAGEHDYLTGGFTLEEIPVIPAISALWGMITPAIEVLMSFQMSKTLRSSTNADCRGSIAQDS